VAVFRDTPEQPIPIFLRDLFSAVIGADIEIEGRARRTLLQPWRRWIFLQQRIANETWRLTERARELGFGQPDRSEIVVDDVLHPEFHRMAALPVIPIRNQVGIGGTLGGLCVEIGGDGFDFARLIMLLIGEHRDRDIVP
jgi:hypothetical protein